MDLGRTRWFLTLGSFLLFCGKIQGQTVEKSWKRLEDERLQLSVRYESAKGLVNRARVRFEKERKLLKTSCRRRVDRELEKRRTEMDKLRVKVDELNREQERSRAIVEERRRFLAVRRADLEEGAPLRNSPSYFERYAALERQYRSEVIGPYHKRINPALLTYARFLDHLSERFRLLRCDRCGGCESSTARINWNLLLGDLDHLRNELLTVLGKADP